MATKLMKDWIVELHNPARKQCTGALGYQYDDGSQANCCLGVLEEVNGAQPSLETEFEEYTNRVGLVYPGGRTSMPRTETIDEVLGNEEPSADETLELFRDDYDEPVYAEAANDDLGYSFVEIADKLAEKYLDDDEAFEVRKLIEDKGWA